MQKNLSSILKNMNKFDGNNEDISDDDDNRDDASVMDSIMQQTMNRI